MFGERTDRRPVTSRAAFVAALLMLAIAVPIAASTMERGEQRLPEPLPAFSIVAPMVMVPPSATLPPSVAIPTPAPRRPSAQKMESASSATPSAAAVADQTRTAVQREVPSTGTASFSGIVRGPAGTPMAGASVAMTDVATGAVRAEKTAADGRFAFFALPAARYSVTVSSPGWATVRRDLTVEEGQQTDREFALRMGAVSEAVTVAAAGVRGADAASVPGVTPRAPVSNVIPPVATRLCDANGRNCLTAPVKVLHVRPVYPTEALARGAQGVVILEATIGQSGAVTDARVLRAVDPALDAAALEAVELWEFTPTQLDGMPTAIIMAVTINFSIP